MKVVICGGGIIGSSCSYYLAKRNISCTIIEQEEVACAASGKAGGFLARNWCESNSSNDLAKLSYNLHLELAGIYPDIGYRNVNTYSATIDNVKNVIKQKEKDILSWVDGPISNQKLLDTDKNTAQVHPKLLCQKFVQESRNLTNSETKVVYDKVVGLDFDNSGSLPVIKAVKLESGSSIEADVVVIAMGPWSHNAADWFPKGSIPKIDGYRAHSVVLKTPENLKISADCLFLQFHTTLGITSPEVYPRPDGSVYICGLGDDKQLPSKASQVEVESWRCNELRKVAHVTCSGLERSEVIAEQACYLPMSPDSTPVIGSIDQVKGAYIASGHSCWGILNSTGTGYAMAELIATGECKSLDLERFNPNRFL